MDTIHTDHLPVQTLEQTRGDFRQMGWAFIETKFCDVKDNRMMWTTEVKVFRPGMIEKLWFKGRHDNAELFWVGQIRDPKAA